MAILSKVYEGGPGLLDLAAVSKDSAKAAKLYADLTISEEASIMLRTAVIAIAMQYADSKPARCPTINLGNTASLEKHLPELIGKNLITVSNRYGCDTCQLTEDAFIILNKRRKKLLSSENSLQSNHAIVLTNRHCHRINALRAVISDSAKAYKATSSL